MGQNFVVDSRIESFFGYAALPIAIAVFIPILRDRHPSNVIPTYGFFKRRGVHFLILFSVYFLIWLGMTTGAPALWTRLFGEKAIHEFRAISKTDGRRPRRCTYAAHIERTSVIWSTSVCLSHEAFWENIKPGDLLRERAAIIDGRYDSGVCPITLAVNTLCLVGRRTGLRGLAEGTSS